MNYSLFFKLKPRSLILKKKDIFNEHEITRKFYSMINLNIFSPPGILSVPSNTIPLPPNIKVIEGAAGNLPDQASMEAALEIKQKVASLTQDDVLLCLITGGGSALLSLPIEPITLEEKSSLIKNLSRAGATINELNVVRIAISQVKGGKLADCGRHCHQIISLIISDIIGDPLELIASGPTIPYTKSEIAPRRVLEKYKLADSLATSIAQVIQKNEDNQDISVAAIKNSQVFLIGSNRAAIDAAMNEAKSLGLFPIFLSAEVQGNVDDISEAFFDLARAIRTPSSLSREEFKRTLEILHAQPNFEEECLGAPSGGLCIVSGGETTVKVAGDGNGGRNQELALRFTKLCYDDGSRTSLVNDILLLSCGTDGIDGNCDAAGAIGGREILRNLPDGEDISGIMEDFILRNDSYNFYKKFLSKYAGDGYHVFTGHTGTNVMDIHLLIMPNTKA